LRFGATSLKQATLFIYFPSILMSLGQGMLIPALPVLGKEFDVSGAVAVQALTAQLLGRTLALIPAGGAIDRWGAKPVMVVGAALATVSGIGAALAPHFAVILLTQFMWGIGMSIWMFGREIAAFDMVSADQRGRQMSALMGIGSTGMAFGPAIGGVLTDAIGVRPLFWFYAIASAIVLVISVAQANTHAHRERKKSGPFFSLNAIKHIHPYYRVTYAVLFISTFGQMARGQVTNSALPLYTQQELLMTPTQTGIIFSFIAIVTFSMIIPTGIISDKLGRKWAAVPAAILSLIGFILIPLFDTLPSLIVAGLIIGVANGLAMGAMTIYTFDIVPAEYRGQLQALRRSVGEVGAVLSPPVVGVLTQAYGASMAFWAVAPLHAIAAILLIFVAKESLKKRLPPGAPGTEAEPIHPAAGP
jgi:MFS family permease